MIKKVFLACLASIYTTTVFSMEQSSVNDFSSLPKDAMEELSVGCFSSIPKDVKKLVVLNCDSIKAIKSFLETSKENTAFFKDPLILSHLLTCIFKIDATTAEDVRSFLATNKETSDLLKDPKIIRYLITKIAEDCVGKTCKYKKTRNYYLDPYSFALEGEKIRIAARLGTESAVTWLKEHLRSEPILVPVATQECFFDLLKNSRVKDVKFLLKCGVEAKVVDNFDSMENVTVEDVKLLLECGIDVKVKDNSNFTPFALTKK